MRNSHSQPIGFTPISVFHCSSNDWLLFGEDIISQETQRAACSTLGKVKCGLRLTRGGWLEGEAAAKHRLKSETRLWAWEMLVEPDPERCL